MVEKSEPFLEGYKCLCVWRPAERGGSRPAVSPRAPPVAIGCFHYNKMMKAPERREQGWE